MTDALTPVPTSSPPQIVDHFSIEAQARVKRRYKAEKWFRAIGLSAILVAAAFVVLLLGDIVRKGFPAFFEHRLTLNVSLDEKHIDPKGKREIADLRAGDHAAIIREAMQALIPGVSDRRSRRLLDGLLSSGAPDDIRALVMRDPAAIGTSRAMPLLLSDRADMYFKDAMTPRLREARASSLDVTMDGKDVLLTSKANDFAALLTEVKAFLARRAAGLERELALLPQAQPGSTLEAKRAELSAQIAALRARAANASAAETLEGQMPSLLVEIGGGIVKLTRIEGNKAIGTPLLPVTKTGENAGWSLLRLVTPESNRKLSDQEAAWLENLQAKGLVERAFATRFFTNGDSREPELAGIRGALIGSALTLLVTLALCLPIGVGAALYLEEFAPKNRLTDILEVNINNLAAVPSIVFGLLGLAVFLNAFHLPRSAPLVGGLVLALLVLPTIIIAARAALKAVPPSIKEAALGVGASHQQAVFHHVLPLAMPGIMTGTIIGMAHALGETAPLLMIGMVAFIVEVPGAITDAATVLPVQIFLWADLPELAFQAKTAAAIMVLLVFLVLMNGLAILLRRRFERRW